MSLFGDILSPIFGSKPESKEAPMTEAGKYLFDQTKSLYDTAGTVPTTKVRFARNIFEIMPKATKERIGLQLSILNALKGMQMNQSTVPGDPGLLGRLAPAIGLAAGGGMFSKLFGGGGDSALNIMDSGTDGLASGFGEGEDWGDLVKTAASIAPFFL